jgi:hypothetical protein
MYRSIVGSLLCLAAGGPLAAQYPDSVTIPAGHRYVAGGPLGWLSNLLVGSRYRDLWGTPVTMPWVDPAQRGLVPIGADTGMRAGYLYFRDGAGVTWTFRPLDKNLQSYISAARRRGVVSGFVQDLQSGRHPGAPLVIQGLMRGAGLGGKDQQLLALQVDTSVVPGLLEQGIETRFRDELDEKSSAITTVELLAQLDAPDPPTVDAQAYLRERLFDIFVGSWDPLPEEWLWVRRRGGLMVPLPRDRDGAFSRFDGAVTSLASQTLSELSSFQAGYGPRLPMTGRLRVLDRRLLTGLDSARWASVTADLAGRLSNNVLRQAVNLMPAEYREKNGRELLHQLEVRRDGLADISRRYREQLLDRGELYGTTMADTIIARRSEGGVLDISIGDRVPVRFESSVTDEVRVYPLAGADRIVLRGGHHNGPSLRIATDSTDVVPDPGATNAVSLEPGLEIPRFVDSGVETAVLRGTRTSFATWLNFNSDLGLQLGGGPVFTHYEPGYSPFKRRFRLRAAFATTPGDGAVDFRAEFRRRYSDTHYRIDAKVSSIEVLKFYGYGNETERIDDNDFYKSDQRHIILAPTMVVPVAGRSVLELGIIAKHVQTDTSSSTFIGQTRPYGTLADFGQLGIQASIRHDTRDATTFARRGSEIRAGMTAYPAILDAEEAFGMLEASASWTTTPVAPLTFAIRGSAKTTWGKYPAHEAAYLGGSRTVRSLNSQRFAGDAAAWANFETRLRIGSFPFVMDWDWGIFGIADAGRVFYQPETSRRIHYGLGGGIWAVVPDRSVMGVFDIVTGDDNRIAFWAGISFIM